MTVFEMIDIVGQIAVLVSGITFYWIVRSVRKEYLQEVKNAVTNPFWPDIDLAFIPWVYKTYVDIKHSALVPATSIASFIVALTAVLISFFG